MFIFVSYKKMRKVRLRLRELYSLAREIPKETYSSIFIHKYDIILLGYTCVTGFHIGGHALFISKLFEVSINFILPKTFADAFD